MATATIREHGLIGNMRSAALVSVFGEVDFFCYPEFDSPSLFASLLDIRQAGCFSISPAGAEVKGTQLYLPETNVLLTRFLSQEAILEVCDFMPADLNQFQHCIMRVVTAVCGDADVRMQCKPAFDYARASHVTDCCRQGVVFTPQASGLSAARLLATVDLHSADGAALADFHLKAGASAFFIFGLAEGEPPADIAAFVRCALQQTVQYWQHWAAKSIYKGRWREAVTRSALTLKLLTSQEHGSIVAAPTFGLPEVIGGIRNWDYRFVWMRDAAFTTYALNRLGYVEEGNLFGRWLENRLNLEGQRGPLEVMYRADGSSEMAEVELSHLSGYRNSKPVLVGNGAATQLQLDIYGELIDSAYLSSKYGPGIPYAGWLKLKQVLRWLADHWQEPDEGIWEVRGGRKEFLHSRLMCWVAFDRAIRLGQKRSLVGPFDWMERCRDAIVNDIHQNFWDAGLGSFVQHKGAKHVDASTLLMPLVRFISTNDPRWLSTLSVIERELAAETRVRRYSSDNKVDGLTGREGGFTACAFWLVEAKARSNQIDQARLLFEKLLSQANPLGLFAEEMDLTGEQLGNFPQALSHLALISAATYLDRRLNSTKEEAESVMSSVPTWSK